MLVGREAEAAGIAAAVVAGRCVLVTGEAGVGKTALLTEALERTGARTIAGQCFRSLTWTAGMPLQQAVGQPIPAGDPAWTAQWLVRHCGDSVLRLDDLQWADALTLTVLGLLPRTVRVVATVRSGEDGSAAAVDALTTHDAVHVDLVPLGADDALELARRAHPGLRAAEAEALARRCGGNPLLIEELGTSPEPSVGLHRTVVGRLRRQGDAVWRGFAMLALAGEPVPAGWLPDAPALLAGGLVTAHPDLQPRHPLLAEVVVTELATSDPQRRRLSRDLADAAERGGRLALAARAAADSGDDVRALTLARRALHEHPDGRPGERSTLLDIAAACASSCGDPAAAELATEAVQALVESADYTRAAEVIAGLPDLATPRWCGLRGRVHWETGADEPAIAAYEQGVAASAPDTVGQVRLRLEHARAVLLGRGDVPVALDLARAAAADARRLGVELARAHAVLGTAESIGGIATAADNLRHAVRLASESGETEVEFTSVNNLVATLETDGDAAQAYRLAEDAAARAGELRLRTWQVQLLAMGLNTRLHTGDYDPILAQVPQLLAGAVQKRTRDQLAVTLTLALIDVGRLEDAAELIADALRHCADDHYGRGNLLWLLSETHLWRGDSDAALDAAREAMAAMPVDADLRLFPLLTMAQIQARAGRPLDERTCHDPALPILAAAPEELAGHAARAAGDDATAAGHYTRAADLWRGRHRRGELRCTWFAADCEPNPDVSRASLLGLERELATLGWAPLLGQVRRSLRARGVRSAAPRGRAGTLTAREREVLDLVAAGLSTAEVAARLGLSPATVAAQVSSARARLGATTRWQAAGSG